MRTLAHFLGPRQIVPNCWNPWPSATDNVRVTAMLKDRQYTQSNFVLSEKPHNYGPCVHLMDDPFHSSLLAEFSEPGIIHEKLFKTTRQLTSFLTIQAINKLFPQSLKTVHTRMKSSHSEASFSQSVVRSSSRVLVVDLMRAGILPSQVCFELLLDILSPEGVRQDHILLNRKTNKKNEVVGVEVSGKKIGGPVDHDFVFIPDPMGATGTTLCEIVNFYKSISKNKKMVFVALHFIITPEFLKRVSEIKAPVHIFALRLDRGLSRPEVLNSDLGSDWNEERGLNAIDYIVPGAGGIGELLNNSEV